MLQTVLYLICLIPISVHGFGVNYSFLLMPVADFVMGKSLVKPRKIILNFLYFSCGILIIAGLYQFEWLEFLDRRVVSFVLFLALFSLCFKRFDLRD
jgi:hypothetical protein